MIDVEKLGALAQVIARDLTEIADLPDYKAPPPGVYKLLIKDISQKEINEKTALVVEYTILDTVELNDAETPEEDKVKPGDLMSEAFWFDDAERIETTLSVLKAKYAGLSEAAGSTNLLEILTKIEGMSVQCVITNRVDKKDKTKIYASTRDMIPAV